jgi:hypothetical protein
MEGNKFIYPFAFEFEYSISQDNTFILFQNFHSFCRYTRVVCYSTHEHRSFMIYIQGKRLLKVVGPNPFFLFFIIFYSNASSLFISYK